MTTRQPWQPPTLSAVLAHVAKDPPAWTWPIFVSRSPDIQFTEQGLMADSTSEVDSHLVRWNEKLARRFHDHPCIVPTGTPDADKLVIGRSSRSDYRIAHESVSATHAELLIGGHDRYRLLDLDSRNGTFVEAHELTPGVPVAVTSSGLVAFGEVVLYMIDAAMVRTLARVAHQR